MLGYKYIIKKIFVPILLSSVLISCSSPNIALENLNGEIRLNTNINDLTEDKIESIKINNKEITKDEYSINNGNFTFPDLPKGKHIITLKIKNSDVIDIPIEINPSNTKNFQFNAKIDNNKISSWEVGIDENKDGQIDKDSYFSKDFESYVIVRDENGTLKYLPKNNFSENYKDFSSSKTPENFTFPEFKENEFNAEKGIKLFDSVDQSDPHKDIIDGLDELDTPFGGNFVLKFPEYKELEGYWISAITNENTLIPINYYLIRDKYLIMDKKTFHHQKVLNIYLVNSENKGYLLTLDLGDELGRKPVPGQNPNPNNNPPNNNSRENVRNLPGTDPKSPPPPQRPPDGVPRNTLVNTDEINFSLKENVILTKEIYNNLIIYQEKIHPQEATSTIDKKLAVKIPNREEYTVFASDGQIENVITTEEAKKRNDIIIVSQSN